MPARRFPQWTVGPDEDGSRLDRFLAAPDRLGSRARASDAIEKGKVFVNGTEMSRGDGAAHLKVGDEVGVWMDRPGSASRRAGPFKSGDLEILFEDDLILVINKPAGLLTVPLPDRGDVSVYSQLEDHLRGQRHRRPFIVHRIDRDTSGLVLFAKTLKAQQLLKAQFKRREPERIYLALVYGRPEPPRGTWRDTLVWDDRSLIQKQTHPSDPRGSEAVCEYRVLESFAHASLIEVRLHTGKRNQIRLQARLRGHTLVGEQRYVFGPDEMRAIDFPRQALHAHRLGFRHPGDSRPVVFEASPPEDFARLVERLRAG